MKLTIKILLLLLFLSWPSSVAAQEGTIRGSVYQNLGGQCSGDEDPPSGWSVTCKGVPAIILSEDEYQCQDSAGNTNLPHGIYLLNLTPPTDWQVVSAAGCPTNPQSVTLSSSEATASPFYLWRGGAWFQIQGGDIQSQGYLSSPIPSSASERNFSLDRDGYPGVVSYTEVFYFGQGGVSSAGWLADSPFSPPKSNYHYFYQKLGSPQTETFTNPNNGKKYCEDGPCPNPPAGFTLYYAQARDVNIIGNNDWNIPVGTKVVVLVDGNLNISLNPNNRRIEVQPGGFLAFIVKGNINIDGQVGNKQAGYSVTPFLQGVYLADGTIDTYEPDPAGIGSGFRFIGAGIFHAQGGFNLQRNLKSDPDPLVMQNSNTPAEFFLSRPDLVLNAPQEIWVPNFSWVEVAP